MPHQDVDIDDYHMGDALDIPMVIWEDTVGGSRQDLSGVTIEWNLYEQEIDATDQMNAVLTKSTSNTGEITITDDANGECTIHIDTGDTDGLLTQDDGSTVSEDQYHHRAKVTDSSGDEVTVVHGSFTIRV